MLKSKGLVSAKQEENYNNLHQYQKGYRQALLDVETWLTEANGDMDFVDYRIQQAMERNGK